MVLYTKEKQCVEVLPLLPLLHACVSPKHLVEVALLALIGVRRRLSEAVVGQTLYTWDRMIASTGSIHCEQTNIEMQEQTFCSHAGHSTLALHE